MVEFDLTEEQEKKVMPCLESAKKAFKKGAPGMVLAQIVEENKFVVCLAKFISNEKAERIKAIINEDV